MRRRLDVTLVSRGLAASRTQARTLVRAGLVRVQGTVVTRPATPVPDDDVEVEVLTSGGEGEGEAAWILRGWVGRGALKLDHALDRWPVPVAGRRCLDVGASTGGFTQVLLERGAAQVRALDVGHDQLDQRLARDPRVVDTSGTSVRGLSADVVGGPVDLLVADLSFISLTLVLADLAALTRPGADLVLLVKPQFEVGPEGLGRGGLVRSAERRERVLAELDARARTLGLAPLDLDHSPVTGTHGNIEYLWWLRRCPHPGPCPVPADGMMGCGPGAAALGTRRRELVQEEKA